MRIHRLIIFCCTALLLVTSACATGQRIEPNEPPLAPPQPPPVELPALIEIGVTVGSAEIRIEGGDVFVARDENGRSVPIPRSGAVAHVGVDGVRLEFTDGTAAVAARWFIEPAPGLTSRDGMPITLDRCRYRGTLRIERSPATGAPSNGATAPLLTVINVVGLEDYLRGVVPREIGFIRPENLEAMKAQAVAARTYAVRNLNRRRDLGFDLMATSADQAYGGRDAETPLTNRAIDETEGELLVHDGTLVDAFYHSTCGGATSSIIDVWGGDRPYLHGVSDQLGDTSACAASRYFAWTETWQGETFARLAAPAEAIELKILDRDAAGRVAMLQITRGDSVLLVRGDAIRRAILRPDGGALRSTLFDVTVESGLVRIDGLGWGHGLGMCQMGAIGRARAGWRHAAILEHYYPGSIISQRAGGP